MVRKTLQICLLSASALALSACDDAIVGKWKTDDKLNCDRRGNMTVDSDLSGDGEIPFRDCTDCKFKLEAKDSDSDDYEYDVKITMDVCTIEGSREAVFGCGLEEGDTILNCGQFYYWKLDED